MISRPDIGREGGQQYPIVKSIQMFLKQMAEGGAKPASTVFKELLQNADDAGATEVSVVLDERKPAAVFSDQYRHLCSPAIILRNNAPFRGRTEVADGEEDDFTAIRNVASGHKRADNTAAGRFGIGFNSVYFLTDTPVIFSRREVNLFDLLHKVIDINGWIFDLDDFPAGSKSSVGEIKTVLEWCLPKHALQEKSFGEIALEGDYQQAAFRLPFRNEDDSEEFLFDASFPGTEDRRQVLMEMAREAKRSIIFMKSVNTISFSILNENGPRLIAKTDVTPNPSEFVRVLEAIKKNQDLDRPVDFERIVTYSEDEKSSLRLSFHVWHSVCPSNQKLAELRRLLEGSDKAVPWVSIAVPLDRQSIQIDGGDGVSWRVFLPLLEPGPSYCLFSGAFFVGPGRQKMEYRVDQGTLKTEWNKALVEHALIELFRDITADLPSIASGLLDTDPKAYLSLFPSRPPEADPSSLTDYFKACFAKKEWWLSVRDIWDTEIELIVGDEATAITLEMIPEWLRAYKHCFEPLSDRSRRFITYALGSALRERLPEMSTVTVAREMSAGVADSVLKSSSPPKVEDLRKLLDIALTAEDPAATIENAWAFVRSNDGSTIQYRANTLYVLDIQTDRDPVVNHLRRLPLVFDNVEWVTEEALAKSWKRANFDLNNIVLPNAKSAIELMHRLSKATGHDVLTQSSQIVPLVDFLITQEPAYLSGLMLNFLVRTAANKTSRRDLGVVFLKALQPTRDDEALWETWFRRLFAEIDPAFAKEINRLLATHPHCLQMLSSDECQVVRAGHEIALNVLNRALKRSPELIDGLRKEINEHRSISDGMSDRISRSIIEYADRTWEDMNEEVKLTLLHLPIHRCADGRFVSLVDSIGPADNYESCFRLQSEDDLRDAPIELPAYILLNWRDSNTKNFYRTG